MDIDLVILKNSSLNEGPHMFFLKTGRNISQDEEWGRWDELHLHVIPNHSTYKHNIKTPIPNLLESIDRMNIPRAQEYPSLRGETAL